MAVLVVHEDGLKDPSDPEQQPTFSRQLDSVGLPQHLPPFLSLLLGLNDLP